MVCLNHIGNGYLIKYSSLSLSTMDIPSWIIFDIVEDCIYSLLVCTAVHMKRL